MNDESPKRVIFAGTPDFAATCLSALLSQKNIEVVAVYTQPDRPKGRGQKLQPSPVKALAIDNDVPVEQPTSLKSSETLDTLATYQADLMVVVAYGLILPQTVLDTPAFGCINVHASLLPRWRGAAPIHRAIEAGDAMTGVGIMQMEAGLDTGPVLANATLPIDDNITTPELHDQLAELGAQTLMETLPAIFNQFIQAKPQNEAAVTYAEKLNKSEALIDWQLSAEEIHRKIRAYQPWPVAYTTINGQRLRLWQSAVLSQDTRSKDPVGVITDVTPDGVVVRCGTGAITISRLQPENKPLMEARDYANGRDLIGVQLG